MLRGIDSGEATRYPTYTARNTSSSWIKVADQPSRWEINSNHNSAAAGVITSSPYTGTTLYRVHQASGGGGYSKMRRHFGGSMSEVYASIMFRTSLLTSQILFEFRDSSYALSVRVMQDDLGRILVYAGTTPTLKKTIVTGWAANEWHQIRVHMKTSGSVLEVKLDSGSTEDCSGTPMASFYYLQLCGSTIGATTDTDFDCLQVNDVSGSLNNSWPDTPRIPDAIRPESDDASIHDWTPNSGSDEYATIDETAPDLDTTYDYSTASGDRSLFGLTDMAEPSNIVIQGVCLCLVAKRADTARIIPLVSRGGTTIELSAVDVGSDYMTPIEVIIEQDPIASAAWTQTNLNATSFGFKHVAP